MLRAVATEDAYANLVLPAASRSARLDRRDAALATELAYGTLRGRGLYDAVLGACSDRPLEQIDGPVLDALRMGAHQLLATRVPSHAAVDQTVALVRFVGGGGAAGFANAVLRKVSEKDLAGWVEAVAPPLDQDLIGHLAVSRSHPQWIVRAMREGLVAHGRAPEEIEELLAADNQPPKVTLALLPGLSSMADLPAAEDQDETGAVAGEWSPYAAVLTSVDPGSLEVVRAGRARVQDEGSQLAALALLSAPVDGRDEAWLDMCAGPGGKAALLAAAGTQRGARLTAVEMQQHRARLVEQALAPIPGEHRVRVGDGREIGADEPETYDRILLDAPCTGLGALRRRPEARWRRQPSDLASLTPLQRDLLGSALDAVRPGGVVAYVTCSPHPAETIAVVSDVARRRDDVQVLDAPALVAEAAGRFVRDLGTATVGRGERAGTTAQLWPHRHGTDGMFISLLRRV